MQETQNVELKETWRDEYLRIIAAFANSQGGKLLLGYKGIRLLLMSFSKWAMLKHGEEESL